MDDWRVKTRPTRWLTLIAIVTIGLCSRLIGHQLPGWISKDLGDVLWSWMFFLLVLIARPRSSIATAAGIALLISFLIEFFKLCHSPWIDAVRATRIGGLLLGHTFLWRNSVSYLIGVVIGVVVDLSWQVVATKTSAPLEKST